MQNTQTASFFAPGFDDQIEQQKIERQRRMAELLQAQAQKPAAQGQMIGGNYVAPSWTEGLAKIFQAYQSGQMGHEADTKQGALAEAMKGRNQQEAKDFFAALRGTPGVEAKTIQPATPNDDEGNPNAAVQMDATPAIPGSQDKAIEMAFNAKSPMVQGYGAKLAEGQLSQQQMMDKMAAAFKMAGQGGGAPGGATTVAPGQPAPAGGGNIGGVNPLAMALTLTGDPSLAKAGGLVADANKPLAAREGDVLVPDGQGGMRSVWSAPKSEPGIQLNRGAGGQVTGAAEIPGYGPAAASIKGATAGATAAANAAQDMVTVNTPQGPKLMTRAQAVALSGGGQPPAMPPLGAPVARPTPMGSPTRPANPMAPQPGDADKAMIFNGEMQQAQARLAAAKTPEELQRAQNDLAGLGREMKAAGIPLQSEGTQAFDKKMGTDQAEMLTKSHETASTAANEILGIGEARKAMNSGTFQGSGANMKLGIAKFINANVPGLTIDPEKVANSDYLRSTLGAGLLQQAKTLGSNPSNADAARINDIVGDLTKDPGAMQKILDWRQSMAERAIQTHNTKIDQSVQNGFKPQFDMRVKLPSAKGNSVLDAADAILRGGK